MSVERYSAQETILCANCRAILPADANFCSFCSAPQKEGLAIKSSGVPLYMPGTIKDHSAKTPEYMSLAKREILDAVHSKTEGIDMDGIKNFFSGYDLEMANVVVVGDDEIIKINNILSTYGIDGLVLGNNIGGTYWVMLDISFVYRNEAYVNKYGLSDVVADIVHEGAHSTSGYRDMVLRESNSMEKLSPARTGFKPINSFQGASFLEEAFAEVISRQYKYEQRKKNERVKIEDENVELESEDGQVLRLSKDYIRQNGGIAKAAIAAAGLELILESDPPLFDLMLSARGDINALREVVHRIDNIKPGLYVKLRKLKYTSDDFYEGYKYIEEALKE